MVPSPGGRGMGSWTTFNTKMVINAAHYCRCTRLAQWSTSTEFLGVPQHTPALRNNAQQFFWPMLPGVRNPYLKWLACGRGGGGPVSFNRSSGPAAGSAVAPGVVCDCAPSAPPPPPPSHGVARSRDGWPESTPWSRAEQDPPPPPPVSQTYTGNLIANTWRTIPQSSITGCCMTNNFLGWTSGEVICILAAICDHEV